MSRSTWRHAGHRLPTDTINYAFSEKLYEKEIQISGIGGKSISESQVYLNFKIDNVKF